ncbi:LysR family transcriptional regulator [Pseudoduganella sp. DS3]|uniref:LysR family transcriptional regulator n=1 Tax=Pseudoduganella guangdongensis TaxID=2692179 RepID=A0A6N9HJ63_9BURK|nr:LysR family transcriptional regulator [Pseudoduganella guangdongensis]MYN03530.1 LysR family transcriptional regulator [Pseudoduganella guangdongensis]
MDTLRSLQCFVRAVELGSLSAVAREQHTTQSNISKIVAALEEDLGVRLLERSTASLSPTVPGRRFYERARGVLEEYADAVADVRGESAAASGLLRINAPVALGQFRLNGFVQEFLRQYPGIEVELILNDRMVDMVEEGVDIAVRLGGELPPNVVARRIGASPRLLVAAPSYLKAHGTPQAPQDLAAHEYIRFAWASSGDALELTDGTRSVTVATHGRYRVNNALAIRDTLAAGGGIGLCPEWLVQDLLAQRKLRRVLRDWQGSAQELHLLYPSRRYLPHRVRLMLDFLQQRFG